jgi:hypothetical protein
MPEWKADFTNDPNHDYDLIIEISYSNEDIGIVRKTEFGPELELFSHNKNIVIPINWLLKLIEEANLNISSTN